MGLESGKIAIVKGIKTGFLGAVVCPEGTRGVVFENGEWIVDTREMDLQKLGEVSFSPPRIEDGVIPPNIQEKYVEAALRAINLYREERK